MKRRLFNTLELLTLVAVLAGCGHNRETSVKSSSNDRSAQRSDKKKSTKSNAKSSKASLNKALAKDKEAGHKQQEHRYALPQGPSWLHVYADGKNTGIALDPTKTVVAKLSEDQTINFIGHLPMVEKVAYGAFTPATASADPTLDQAKVADKVINEVVYFQSGTDTGLKVTGTKAIAKRAFKDLPQYIAAHNAQDATKLPNQTESLKNALGDDTDPTGQPKNTYQLQAVYFNRASADDSDDSSTLPYITVMADDGVNKASTNLHLEVWVKATATPSGVAKGQSKPKTVMVKYGMVYQLQGQQWILTDVANQQTSDYAIKTTGTNWMTQKY